MTCEDIKSGDGVKRVKSISGAANNEYGVLTGVFDYQGKVALYVVNWDTTAEQDITVKFENLSKYRLVYAEDVDTVVDNQAIGSSCTVTLGAGQAALIVIEEEDLATTTQYFENIAQYRTEKATMTVNGETYEYYTEAPELDGYVFAGWYTSEEEAGKDYTYASGQTVASSDEKNGAILASKTDGEAWAKYVDESILSVKGQISTDVTAESETARIRIVTSTNSLIYQGIGFDIKTRGKTATAMGTKVFEKIVAKTGNDKLTFNYTPQESFNSHSYYFQTAILKVKAKGYLDESIIVKPFWTTADGTKVYGVTRTLTVNQGIQANNVGSGSVYSLR